MNRRKVLSTAIDDCIKEIYSFAIPKVSWKDFIEENKIYSEKYNDWKYNKYPDWKNKSIKECIGPRPYEFYYLPKEILKSICDSYIDSYKIDSQKELLDTIQILKKYCKEPIIDKYIEGDLREDGTRWPGHRGYDYPDNLEKEIEKILFGRMSEEPGEYREESAKILQNKFFEFLDMAGNFYNWNSELNTFNMSVYLGPSPSSNKETVIENWKKYRKQDIEIDEEQIKKDYYGEED